MNEAENQHKPRQTFSAAISLPFINSSVFYFIFKIDLVLFSGNNSYDPDGPLLFAIILVLFSFIPALIFALAVTLVFKPTKFTINQNSFIWASIGILTATFIGFFSSGLTDMQGWFADGTGWVVLVYGLAGFCAGRYLVQSKTAKYEKSSLASYKQDQQVVSSTLRQATNLANQITLAAPALSIQWL